MSETRTLVKKLAAVMAAVTHVPKGGTNGSQGYKFARDVDVLASVRLELAKRNVILTNTAEETSRMMVETRSGAKMQSVSVKMTFTAHDGDSGEVLPFSVGLGEAMDAGDKSVYKAETGATKYGILKGFLIPTGEDPEADEETDRAVSAPAATIPPPAPRQAARAAPPSSGMTFPPFGNHKGEPIAGADMRTLQFYASAAQRSLDDPTKERFHNKERQLLAALNAEMARHGNGAEEEADVSF
jgi:hypothetical protein